MVQSCNQIYWCVCLLWAQVEFTAPRRILFCIQPGRHREVEEKEEREEEDAKKSTEICVIHRDENQGAG